MRIEGSFAWIILSASLWWEVDSCETGSQEIGVCLHTYLERDFHYIKMLVYPNRNDRRYYRPDEKAYVDGPELRSNCHYLRDTLKCFEEVIPLCYSYKDMYSYQHLIDSLTKTYKWLCEDIENIRHRFLVLLQSLRCLERVRMNTPACYEPEITENIWTKILRVETDTSICPLLQKQRKCLLSSSSYDVCGFQETQVYKNVTSIFFDSWCNTASKVTNISLWQWILLSTKLIYDSLKNVW